MAKQRLNRALPFSFAALACLACAATRDLDAAGAGSTQQSGGTPASSPQSTSTDVEQATGGTATLRSSGSGGANTIGSSRRSSTGGGSPLGGALSTGGTDSESSNTNSDSGGAPALGTGGSTASDAGGTPPTSGGSSVVVFSIGGKSTTGGASSTASVVGGRSSTGGVPNVGGGQSATGGAKATGGSRSTGNIAPDLGDLLGSPVEGFITYSTTASWDIGRVQKEAFRIETPTATYFVVKSVAAITSLVDANNVPWVLYSTDYRTHRGVPNLGGCCQPNPPNAQPAMNTVLDAASATSSHLRLVSKSVEGDGYWIVWDFYLTHVTITVNRSPSPFGFTYDGVPGNTLDGDTDHLVLSTGEVKSAKSYYSEDLPGPAEWAYITNGETKSGSLFLIQHTDDNLPDSYSVPDGDGSRLTFGSGQITATPIRFSLGLIDSTNHAKVSERVNYVIDNIPP